MSSRASERSQIQTRVSPPTYEALQEDAKQYRRSVSASVALILDQWADSRDSNK